MRSIAQNVEPTISDLVQTIQGYEGYRNREKFRQTERRLKNYLAERLRQVETGLSEFEHRCYQQRKTSNLNSFNRISLSLKMLIQTLQEDASDNNAIATTGIDEAQAAQLEQQDRQLVEQVNILSDEVQSLDDLNGEFEIEEMLNHLYDLLDGINQTLSEREFLMMSD
ncbi:MAG: hypothetical protein ONB31_08865 [candidate division KSB1 bacterium]|nr:hypothetical protein [candidate division KSB1 bacterium]MDZ7335863.1 hypothetical protein [candidate division KSB1 bacterium]MDZ7357361.1 hypothetical protein [candidate division KSB1 bacterium]MDZ7398929.1 hypothetical protein [candidate division KSB1 bacterium]